uniref:Immunoglobulin V-set domain-containing protein n=1 Tax=Myripristis murdjan TaxID=586833 RepID=A0A667WDC0_9TELE
MNDFETKLSMYVFPSTGDTFADDITAIRAEVYSSQGRSVTLSSADTNDYFFWYRQDPGKPPQFLLSIYGFKQSTEILKSDPRISTKLSEDKRGVDLEISSAAVTHSALYYCAVRPTVTGNTQSLYKNLTANSRSCTTLQTQSPRRHFLVLSTYLKMHSFRILVLVKPSVLKGNLTYLLIKSTTENDLQRKLSPAHQALFVVDVQIPQEQNMAYLLSFVSLEITPCMLQADIRQQAVKSHTHLHVCVKQSCTN